jgi:hypothetical protein
MFMLERLAVAGMLFIAFSVLARLLIVVDLNLIEWICNPWKWVDKEEIVFTIFISNLLLIILVVGILAAIGDE